MKPTARAWPLLAVAGAASLRLAHAVGSVPVSRENSAACDDSQVMPCVASTGSLTFEPAGEGLPRLKVSSKGTTIASPGKVREMTAADAVTYTFDEASEHYRQ